MLGQHTPAAWDGLMGNTSWGKHFGEPALLLLGVLALFSLCLPVRAQSLTDLPAPPPVPRLKPKPTPTPQPPPKDEDFDVIRVSSNLVMVPVSVVDASGQPVRGLQVSDFRLEEQGRPQEIAQIGDPDSVPLEIALLIDVSGSTHDRFDFELEAAARFLKQVLKAEDRATVYLIDRTPKLKQARLTADSASQSLLSIQPAVDKGPTAFFDTVVEAARYLATKTPPQHRRVMLIVSDGVDNFSEKIKKAIGTKREEQESATTGVRKQINSDSVSEVQREVQKADAVFYSINPSGNTMHLNMITKRGQDGMEQIADATGGTAFVPQKPEDLNAVFNQIAAELRAQYLLQYYSNSKVPGSQFRGIKVGVPARQEAKVRARQGYYPKAKDEGERLP